LSKTRSPNRQKFHRIWNRDKCLQTRLFTKITEQFTFIYYSFCHRQTATEIVHRVEIQSCQISLLPWWTLLWCDENKIYKRKRTCATLSKRGSTQTETTVRLRHWSVGKPILSQFGNDALYFRASLCNSHLLFLIPDSLMTRCYLNFILLFLIIFF
jgi:hypothetical protein